MLLLGHEHCHKYTNAMYDAVPLTYVNTDCSRNIISTGTTAYLVITID